MKIKFLFILMLFLAILPAGAQFSDYIYWSYNGSIVFLASDNGNKNPPQIVPSLGISAAYSIFKHLRVELTEDVYFANYEFNGYPMACEIGHSEAFVAGFTTGLQLTGFFPVAPNETAFRFYGGLAADLRLVTHSLGLSSYYQNENKQQVENITNYFWANGRMFFASMGLGIDIPFSDKQSLGIDLRAWAPLYRLWTDKDLPEIDGWRFGAGIRISPRKPLHPLRPTRAPRQRQPSVPGNTESADEETTE
ncbi:MAG: hypothetical protein LBU88_06035 [Treponema sp.]|jgi:hypothetical protein|nr:hypothetical protein [Treponema sp.]